MIGGKYGEDAAKFAANSNDAFAYSDKLFLFRRRFVLDNYVCSLYIHAMKRVSMFLSDSQITVLKKLAKRTGIKMSELVRRFIDEGLKRN